jgi:hypothetical protein
LPGPEFRLANPAGRAPPPPQWFREEVPEEMPWTGPVPGFRPVDPVGSTGNGGLPGFVGSAVGQRQNDS